VSSLTLTGLEVAGCTVDLNFETVRGSLSIARSTSHGWADLLLRQTRTETRSSSQGDECVTHERPAKFSSRTLRYDGAAYRAAKGGPASD
jgi:hypothetical protein